MSDAAELAIGLMSGTSMDGIDAVLAEFVDGRFHALRAHYAQPYSDALRDALLNLSLEQADCPPGRLAALDAEVGDVFASAACGLIRKGCIASSDVRVIGSHGQTVFHDPCGEPGITLQIGDPNRIAAATGITTVADFRRRDVAEGGQGAPLAPAFHHASFARDEESRCVVNIGGIANVTLLPSANPDTVIGYDTGPGNGLMDEWCQRRRKLRYDADGAWAASGHSQPDVLAALLADPWFAAPAPKSTGREHFNLRWALARCPGLESLPPEDVQRSFCELTSTTILQAARDTGRLLVCGGGARNGFLLDLLRRGYPGTVETTDAHGIDPQHVEAVAFAWLALRRLAGRPGNLPAVTGARRQAILGGIFAGKY